ncbi:MAG TPA: hypothetical protein VFG47_17805 [Geminicoccaceae bacterium]|nr:hypothetical protein [Geminicoccaceae bacterium]
MTYANGAAALAPGREAVAPRAPRADGHRPELRLVHHMARSGGTLFSKCLGCMDGVLLLSEIHPLATRRFNPLDQAQGWFRLLTDGDVADLRRGRGVSFPDAIGLIRRRAAERGRALVIRDWSHLDFTGVPFVERPPYRLLTAEALRPVFALRQLCTVRHPLDQWLSLRRLALIQGRLTPETYLRGYRAFAEVAAGIGFVRYEDLTRDPAQAMRRTCERLALPFDPGFADRWWNYRFVTGDVYGTRNGTALRPTPRRETEPGLAERFAANEDYAAALALLGYAHDA